MTAIIGDLSIVMADGTELRASTDVGLARAWAQHEYGDSWFTLSFTQQSHETAAALAALRAAAEESK